MALQMLFPTIVAFSLLSNAVLAADLSESVHLSHIGPKSKMVLTNEDVSPDGYNRSAIVINGRFPAPVILADKNDEFVIQVYNNLTDTSMPVETSIHWHGIFQNRSNWADGVAFVTQCPIRQNNSFEYRFNVTGQTGTFWYHSHYSTQYCDGLRGPLVIYDPDDPLKHLYDVDNKNTIITLSDWYHSASLQLTNTFAAVDSNATLINGRGRYSGGPSTPFSVVNVTEGKRYRFRVVSTSCHAAFNFSIDGHTMTIIETDGIETEPVDVDSIPIYAGQRYSVVVNANQTVGNYWIRALSDNSSFDDGQNMAILRYEGASDDDPTTDAGPYNITFDEGNLHPLIDPAAPGVPEIGKADVNLLLSPGVNSSGYYTFNNVSFDDPTIPILLQILSGTTHPSDLLPNGSVYELPRNKVIEISFGDPTSAPGDPHPMHLHGHAFYVVRTSSSNDTNFVNPVRRDVVSIGNESWNNVTIRFVTDNPGPWFLHCHIDWHLYHGFAAVMAEARDEVSTLVTPPAAWYDLCSAD